MGGLADSRDIPADLAWGHGVFNCEAQAKGQPGILLFFMLGQSHNFGLCIGSME